MNTLQVAAENPWPFHAAAATILYVHIAGGTVALVAGPIALGLRKGSRLHALAGTIFVASMLVMASIGALVAPFLVTARGEPKLFDSLGALFTCYLVATSWMTVRRKAGTIGRFEAAACIFAVALAAGAVLVGTRRAGDAQGFYVLGGLIALAAALDLKVLLKRGITGTPRIARHVWRMCLALLVAVGSFFLGLQRVMPEFMQGSPLLFIPPLATLAVTIFWLLRLRFARTLDLLVKNRRLRGREAAAIEGA